MFWFYSVHRGNFQNSYPNFFHFCERLLNVSFQIYKENPVILQNICRISMGKISIDKFVKKPITALLFTRLNCLFSYKCENWSVQIFLQKIKKWLFQLYNYTFLWILLSCCLILSLCMFLIITYISAFPVLINLHPLWN